MTAGERALLVGGFKRGELAVLKFTRPETGGQYADVMNELAKCSERTGVQFLLLPHDLTLIGPPASSFLDAVRALCVAARTSGGVAGRDDGLCAALDRVEALLPAMKAGEDAT